MRKLFIIILAALLAGVAVVALIETDPGYILLAYGNYTLESSLWVGLLAIALFTFTVYFLLRLVRKALSGQNSLAGWLGNRQSRKSSRLTNQGLFSFIEGSWTKSRRQLLGGVKGNNSPVLNYLGAARASQALNEPDKALQYLDAARNAQSGADVVVELTQAEMYLRSGEYKQALAVLEKSRGSIAKHPYMLELMYKAYIALADWSELEKLLPEMKKHKTLGADELQKLERKTYASLLTSSASGASDSTATQLQAQWQKLPAELKRDQGFCRAYVALLVQCGDIDCAEKIILRSLKKDWDTQLVRQYGLMKCANTGKQLTQAESWLAAHDGDAQLLLCLGRLCARDSLWGKARDYYEASYRLQRSAEICAELGRLLYGMGEETVSGAYFREGLLLAQPSLPQLPMPGKDVFRSRALANQGAS
ncbi:MAG: HemY protein [Halioglobus sp.]|jgi:HemY protein